MPIRVAVLLSGTGRSLENLLCRCGDGRLDARVVRVIASKECLGAEKARAAGVPTAVMTGTIAAAALEADVAAHGAELVVLAGYLKLLPIPESLRGRVVNIHPSLLPAFGGPGMHGHKVHEAVLARGCKVSGCTVHFCDDRYDTGPIIVQRTCAVLESESPETLAARVFEQECEALPEAIGLIGAGRVTIDGLRTRIAPAAPAAPAPPTPPTPLRHGRLDERGA